MPALAHLDIRITLRFLRCIVKKSSPFSAKIRAIRCLALTLPLTTIGTLYAQFNAIGFEGTTIQNIPYDTSVGIPSYAVGTNAPFNYSFAIGNNLQNFQTTSGGGIVDTDDAGWTVASESGNIPDYYRSPQFLWKHDGYKTTPTDNTNPGWGTGFNASYGASDGYDRGVNLPGGSGARDGEGTTGPGAANQFSEVFSINRDFSTSGNIPFAPGLGSQFLDTHIFPGVSSQFSLAFAANETRSYYTTFAFGGRDNTRGTNSANERAYFRIFDVTTGTSVLSGDTTDMPYEAYAKDIQVPAVNTSHSVTPTTANVGVIQTNWEYFKGTFNVVAGRSYQIQIMMPNEINFDMAIGTNYTNISSITGGVITPVPEASTYGVVGIGFAAGFAFSRRRRPKPISS